MNFFIVLTFVGDSTTINELAIATPYISAHHIDGQNAFVKLFILCRSFKKSNKAALCRYQESGNPVI
jgi:hypothetical protein